MDKEEAKRFSEFIPSKKSPANFGWACPTRIEFCYFAAGSVFCNLTGTNFAT